MGWARGRAVDSGASRGPGALATGASLQNLLYGNTELLMELSSGKLIEETVQWCGLRGRY